MAWKFGLKQYGKPTPGNISRMLDISAFIMGALVTWLTSAKYIPASWSEIIVSILGLFIAIALGMKPFFSADMEGIKKVDIKDVKEVEQPKE